MMFQKSVAIFLVVLYTTAMVRPFVPFMEYALNYEYISTVLCENKDKPEMGCHGKCHLAKEVEKQQNEEKPIANINLKEYPIGFVNILKIKKRDSSHEKLKTKFGYIQSYSYLFSHKFFQPPQITF